MVLPTVLDPNPLRHSDLDRLRQALHPGPVLILTHHNPDPDALSSGDALAFLLEQTWGITSRKAYSGLVERAENVAVLKHLTPGWRTIASFDEVADYGSLSIVDTQPGATNNILPTSVIPDAVFDHHLAVDSEWVKQVAYVDLRPEVGAAATLLFQHLEVAGVEIPARLATALFYGIKTDTSGLARDVFSDDERAYLALRDRIDASALVKVEYAKRPAVYFRELARGLSMARVHGSVVVANLGEIHWPDFTAELADQLIRLVGARAVLCLGHHQGVIYLSVRTLPLDKHAWRLLRKVIAGLGQGGGHRVIAGGQIVLEERDASAVEAELITRFLAAMGEDTTPGLKLTEE
jgi:nanoRNase/pAp phosphatase (c-di-AMP/oligoRNAs hydrolase)